MMPWRKLSSRKVEFSNCKSRDYLQQRYPCQEKSIACANYEKGKKNLYANATKLLLLIKIYTLFVVHTTQTCSWKVGQSPDSMYSIVGCTLHWHNSTQSLTRCCCIFSENGSNQILVHHQQPERDVERICEAKFNTQTENVEHNRTTEKISPGSEHEQSKDMFFDSTRKIQSIMTRKKACQEQRN